MGYLQSLDSMSFGHAVIMIKSLNNRCSLCPVVVSLTLAGFFHFTLEVEACFDSTEWVDSHF